jgi:hypothetical protein
MRYYQGLVLDLAPLRFALCALTFDLFFSAGRSSQKAKREWRDQGGFYFCLLHFAFCLLTCFFSHTFAFCALPFDLLFRVVSAEA